MLHDTKKGRQDVLLINSTTFLSKTPNKFLLKTLLEVHQAAHILQNPPGCTRTIQSMFVFIYLLKTLS